jgi:hypothetical protein
MENKSMSLVSIVEYINALDLAIMESAEKNLGEIDEGFQAQLVEIESRIPEKVDGYAFVIDALSSRKEFWKQRKDLADRVMKCIDAHDDRLKQSLIFAMKALKSDHIDGVETMFRLMKAKKKVVIDDESLIPSDYKEITQTIKVKKDLVLADIESDISVPGAHTEDSVYVRAFPIGVKK